MNIKNEKRVLVAALDWGMGHASRCVPVIRKLQEQGCFIILASNGKAKDFLIDYFPELPVIDKPGYNIRYSEKRSIILTLILRIPFILLIIIKEHFWLKRVIREYKLSDVISDNCYGLWNKKIYSVFITHQLNLIYPPVIRLPGKIVDLIISFFIRKYNVCHIPDFEGMPNYSGILSHIHKMPSNARFIGTLSRFSDNKNYKSSIEYDLVILLSGPEPQRTIFENKCVSLLEGQKINCCIVRGFPNSNSNKENTNNITWKNHLNDDDLKAVLLNAKKIICRSGYSTIMDLLALNLKATLIPTPGQTEQEYLAEYNSGKYFKMKNQETLSTSDFSIKENVLIREQS